MDFWQFNAFCEAFKEKQIDALSLQVQAAYLNAYWNGAQKHKKSLQSVLKELYKKDSKNSAKPIDIKKVSEDFKHYEDIKKYGWTKI